MARARSGRGPLLEGGLTDSVPLPPLLPPSLSPVEWLIPATKARLEWLGEHGIELDERKRRVDQATQEVKDAFDRGDLTAEAREALLAEREALETRVSELERPLNGLVRLERESHLVMSWKAGEPSLLSAGNAWRSFKKYAGEDAWDQALRCVSPSDKATARKFYADVMKAVADGATFESESTGFTAPGRSFTLVMLLLAGGRGGIQVGFQEGDDHHFMIDSVKPITPPEFK